MATYNLGRVLPIFKGTWDNSTQYKRLDVVYWTTSSWVAISDNTNSEPNENNSNWLCIAKGSSNYSEWSEQDKNAIYSDFIQYFEAPDDGKSYVRKNEDWQAIQDFHSYTGSRNNVDLLGINKTNGACVKLSESLFNNVTEAPEDGKQYVRRNGDWETVGAAIDPELRNALEWDENLSDEYIFTNSSLTVPCSLVAGQTYHMTVSSDYTFANLSLIANFSDNTWAQLTNTRYTNTTLEFDFTPAKNVVSIGTNYAYQPSATPWSVKIAIPNPDVARVKRIESEINSLSEPLQTLDDLTSPSKLTPDSYINNAYFDENQHNIISSSVTTGYKLAVYNVKAGSRLHWKATSAIGNYNYITVVDVLDNEVQHVFGNYVNDSEGDLTLVDNASKVYLQIARPNISEDAYGIWQSELDTFAKSPVLDENEGYTHEIKEWITSSATNEEGYNFMEPNIPAFLVIGQSNADGRIPNSSFPSNISYNGDTITMNKIIPTCKFRYGTLGGFTEQYYTSQTSWQSFESRNNSGLWAFDDILYNLLALHYGEKEFYVVKCTMGATGLQSPTKQTMAIYSWNAELVNFKTKPTGKDGSMAMVTKLNCKRALELVSKLDFKAIFMHQGENDCKRLTGRTKGTYFEDLANLIDFCRAAIKNYDCPFIFGSVPTNSRDYDAMIYYDQQKIAERIHKCHLVTMGEASGWVNDGLNVHFLAPDAIKLAEDMYDILVDYNYL